jgi:uncharacterized repeat protein (TIGR01451 family)
MKKLVAFGAAVTTGVVVAGAMTTTAYAWHPKGQIKKSVQNQTANSALADANDVNSAVSTKPGDVLKYVIEVSNVGSAASNGYNDMAKTVMTDTLPAGVELVSNPSKRTISENLGTLKPGQKVTKEYLVRVTSSKDKDVVTNKACYTGDSTANDNPQSGCDPAVVTVTVPPKPEEPPKPPKTPEPPKEVPVVQGKGVEQPAELPKTGPADVAGLFTGFSTAGYVAHRFVTRRKR